ncbi:MAG: hypothetical protein AAGB31_11085 [Bdellovibrio sp.]
MKRILMLFLVLFFNFSLAHANSDKVYYCLDMKTGGDGGKFSAAGSVDKDGNGQIIYSGLSSSNEGWLLTLTEDGKLFNADLMVKQGDSFYVGQISYESFQLRLEIKGRKLICE